MAAALSKVNPQFTTRRTQSPHVFDTLLGNTLDAAAQTTTFGCLTLPVHAPFPAGTLTLNLGPPG